MSCHSVKAPVSTAPGLPARMMARYLSLAILLASAALLAAPAAVPVRATSPGTPGSVLPRKVVLSLRVVRQYFPQVTRQASTGRNLTAVGIPKATRSVIYATGDGSKKVTLSVDQYASAGAARSAYQEAVRKSKIPGFKPLPTPHVNQRAFASTVTRGSETHVGIGSQAGTLVVGATLAGFSATPGNVAKLVRLIRKEDGAARAALGTGR